MRKFIRKALEKLGKMDLDQVRALIVRMSEENDLLGMLLESMTDGIIVTDREHRVMLYNKSAERLFPFSQDDIMERVLWDCLADRELGAFFSANLRNHSSMTNALGSGFKLHRVIHVCVAFIARLSRLVAPLTWIFTSGV